MLSDARGLWDGGERMFWVSNLYFFIGENWISPWTDIMLSQTFIYYWQEIFHIDSGVRQWSHPLMIPLHCLSAKSNNRAWSIWIRLGFVGLGFVGLRDLGLFKTIFLKSTKLEFECSSVFIVGFDHVFACLL